MQQGLPSGRLDYALGLLTADERAELLRRSLPTVGLDSLQWHVWDSLTAQSKGDAGKEPFEKVIAAAYASRLDARIP